MRIVFEKKITPTNLQNYKQVRAKAEYVIKQNKKETWQAYTSQTKQSNFSFKKNLENNKEDNW